jgi:hypothetical protein
MLKAAPTGKRFDIEAATAQIERARPEMGREAVPLSDYAFTFVERPPRSSLVASFSTTFAESFSNSIALGWVFRKSTRVYRRG